MLLFAVARITVAPVQLSRKSLQYTIVRIICIFVLDIHVYSVYNIIIRRWSEYMRAREVEKILLADGWYFVKQVGSHRHYKHPTKKGKITIPWHTGDLNSRTEKSILTQAGLL